MASANASSFTQEKVVDLKLYKRQKEKTKQITFKVGNYYQCKMVPGLFVHIIGYQSIEADFTRPNVWVAETNVGDLAVLMEGDEDNWIGADDNLWEQSIPEELKIPEE